MNLAFQSPALLWTLPIAAAPILFHLFFRVRARKRTFPALLFFLAADPRMGARRKLREWLTLALRCLALLCASFALSRPMLRGTGSASPNLLVLVDNSASMAAKSPTGESRLTRAISGATALLTDQSIHAAAIATTVRDPATSFPDSLEADTAQIRAALETLSPTDASGNPANALARLGDAAGKTASHPCEAHIFTDLQSADWLRTGDTPPALPIGTEVFIHDVAHEGDRAGTVAIAAITPPSRNPVAGRPWTSQIELVNTAPRAADVTLDSAIADSTPTRQTVTVPAKSRKSVAAQFSGGPAGIARAHIALGGQAAAPASEAWFAIDVVPTTTAWLAGDARRHGLLAPALSPDGPGALTGLATKDLAESELSAILAGDAAPSVVAMTPHQLSANSRDAQSWLARGGTIIIAPEPGAEAPSPLSLDEFGLSFLPAESAENGAPLSALSKDDPFWRELRDATGDVALHGALAFHWQPIAAKNGAPLLSVSKNGAPQNVLTRIDIGNGSIFASGIAWDMRSSTLPRRAVFLAIAQSMAHPRNAGENFIPAVAGAPVAANGAATLRFRGFAGQQSSWLGSPDDAPPPPRAGLYELRRDNEEPVILSVRGDDAEADSSLSQADDIPIFANLNPHVFKYTSATATIRNVTAARSGHPLFAIFIAIACLFLVGETIVANRFG